VGVKIQISGEFNPRAFSQAAGALDALRAQSVAASAGMAGGFVRSGQAMQQWGQKMQRAGAATRKVGRTLTTHVSMPIAAIGVASVVMAVKYESAMNKIEALAGASAEEVRYLNRAVLDLAPAVGVGPTELMKALYPIESMGLRGADAMNVLTAAAQAAQSGLGDMTTIADAVTSAINAYGAENISAARATEVMITSVRAGKMEAEAFAGSLGKTLPIASKLEVSFDQVGAAIATMSRMGEDPKAAATGLTQMLTNLLKPSTQGAKMLDKLGMSYAGIRREIAEKGLLPAMEHLAQAFGDNDEAAAKLFSKKGLTTFFTMTGKAAKTNAAIFRDVANSEGSLADAWAIAQQDAAVKIQKAWADVKVALTEIGAAMLPTVLSFAKSIGDLARRFDKLSPSTKKWAIVIALAVAALGPLLALTGSAISGIGAIAIVAGKAAVAIGLKAAATNAAAASTGANTTALIGERAGMMGVVSASGLLSAALMGVAAGAAALLLLKLKQINDETMRIYDEVDKGYEQLAKQEEQLARQWDKRLVGERTSAQLRKQMVAAEAKGDQKKVAALTKQLTLWSKVTKVSTGKLFAGFTIDKNIAKKTDAQWADLRQRTIHQLKVTGAEADQILRKTFGKKYPGPKVAIKRPDIKPVQRGMTALELAVKRTAEVTKRYGPEAGRAYVQGLKEQMKPGPVSAKAALMAAAIRAKAMTLGPAGQAAGRLLAQGVAQGISSATSTAALQAEQMARRVADAARAAMKIKSPSKVGIDIGVNFSIGVAKGIEKGTSKAVAAARKLARDTASALRQQMKERASELSSAFELFSPLETTASTPDELMAAMQSNVSSMQSWMDNIAALGTKLPKALMQALVAAGPASGGQVAALAGMSPEQLSAWAKMWKQLQTMSKTESQREMAYQPGAKTRGNSVIIHRGGVVVKIAVGKQGSGSGSAGVTKAEVEQVVAKAFKQLAAEINRR
jgi:TP901 family phage tail tape measure protein